MEPRIYTYKITFKEIPDWYWGSHKEKKYGESYLGSPETHAWKWEFYTPILEICEFFPYTNEGWAEAREVENRCILPDLNNPLCLNEHAGGSMSLETCRRAGAKGGKKAAKKLHEEKDELGRSINGVKAAERLHKEKDNFGKSLHNLKLHKEKDVLGRSVHAMKAFEKANEEKDELGKSVNAVKGAAITNSQKWKDPDHPELGEQTPGNLAQMQQRRGYPHGKENRVRV